MRAGAEEGSNPDNVVPMFVVALWQPQAQHVREFWLQYSNLESLDY